MPIAVLAGVVAATSDASPTGTTWSDALLVIAGVTFVAWAGASAPWWVVALAAGVAAATAGSVVPAAVGVVAFVAALWIGTQRRDLSVLRAVVVGVALNVLVRSELDATHGVTAAVGFVVAAVVVVSGIRRRSRRVRRGVVVGLGAAGVSTVLATAGLTTGAVLARDDLSAGERAARDGIDLVNDGEYAAAADRFDEAAAAFASADDRAGAPWTMPSMLVPVAAQHREAVVALSDTAGRASSELATALRVVDPDQLRLVGGRIDVDAVELAQQPFRDVRDAFTTLQDAVASSASPWLLEPVSDRLADLSAELDDNEVRLDNAVRAIEAAPALLGSEGPRRWFLAFTTPAETRGLGGFMGNWAELTADDGRIRLTEFGRTRDLNLAGDRPRTVTGPDDWVEQWGGFGFTNGPDGGTGEVPWSNVTASPEFPSTAQVMAELYPQSGGVEVDGVFAVDPYVLEALIGFTGPIRIDGSDERLDASNVLDFLLVDQYELDDDAERVDLLEEVSRATIDEVLRGALPDPTTLARELGPLAAEGRLVGWAARPDEQELFEAVGLDGAMPALDGGDGIAAVLNNAGANKLDVYLERSLRYTATVDERTGRVVSEAEITLTNTVPESGLPDAVTGNYTGDERGTNRTLLSVYSALPLTAATIGEGDDREVLVTDRGAEAGWLVHSAFVAVPPGESTTVRLEFAGVLDLAGGYSLSVRPQPMVIPETQSVLVEGVDGDPLVEFDGVVASPTTWSFDPTTPER